MRTVDALLIRAGRSGSLAPAVKISIGDVIFYNNDTGMETCRNTEGGEEWTAHRGNRIELVQTFEQPYGNSPNEKSKIVLNNADNFLTDLNFKGKRVVVYWGAETSKGYLYDRQPPYYVKEQVRSEGSGSHDVTLTLLGLTDWLGEDIAQCDYISNRTDTLYDLAEKVLEASIPPFDGCKVFNIINDAFDGVFDVVIPGPSFKITQGKDSRATVIARLLDLTNVKIKPGGEDLINNRDSVHFFIPTKTVTHEISLDETDPKYFVSSEYSEIFAPNEIRIKNPNNEGTVYSGKAKDLISWNAIPTVKTEYISGLTSEAQATLVASTLLQNIKSFYNGFSAKVPMMFGLELFDRPKITSPRTGKAYSGNAVTLKRVYSPRKSEPQYYMEIQTGKWFDPRNAWDVMGVGAGYVDTSEENKYTYVFVPFRSYAATLGNWYYVADTALAPVFLWGESDGNWVKFKVKCPSGIYKFRFGYWAGNNGGVLKTYVDDVLAITLDEYYGLQMSGEVDEDVTIAASTSDWHEIKFLIDGKNGSSSDYYCNFTDFVLYPY